jgi:SSS family solute:Na+ symporter
MVTLTDYVNIAFYLCFIIGVSIYFLRRSKNTSDYFRGGGVLPWWMTGAMAWMSSFSAWTFTGAAGKIYQTGPYVLVLYYSSVLPLVAVLSYTCYRFRRMRVITPFEAVRLRFGAASQQFFTWLRLPFLLLFPAVTLNAVGVFMAAVFNVPLAPVLVVMGSLVTCISLLGGAFGVAASDFVQMFLVVSVAATTAVLGLAQPAVGGMAGLIAHTPRAYYHWSETARPEFIVLWFMALMVNNFLGENSIDKSVKYLSASSDRHAQLAASMPLIGTILGPLVWMIPPMVSAVTHPHLGVQFPRLGHPEEAAFLATAIDVLPNGMLGLLICGIFAATLTSMDAGLNQGAGIFVRNFYLPVLRPDCPEKRLLRVSKICTGVFGAIIVTLAVEVNRYRTSNLFDLLNQLGVSLTLPLVIPLFLGLFYKRTPGWSSWSTVLVGLVVSLGVNGIAKPAMFARLPGFHGPYNPEEVTLFTLFVTVVMVGGACIVWFFFTSLFYGRTPAAFKAAVDEFFERLRLPVAPAAGLEKAREDQAIAGSIGKLCLIYGGFIMLTTAAPNAFTGRLCFLACGGTMFGVGWFLSTRYRTGRAPLLSGETGPKG